MTWDDYFEKMNYWSVSTSVKRMSSLENMGASDEVAAAIEQIAFEDKKGAIRLLNKAIEFGVRFSGEELMEIDRLRGTESFQKAFSLSAEKFTEQDLEDLYGCIDDEIIVEIAKQYQIPAPEDIVNKYEEVFCTDVNAPINWSCFYDWFNDWSSDYAIKRAKALSDFGDDDEVIEVVNALFKEDEAGASDFIRRAVQAGVKFDEFNLVEISLLCDKKTVEQAVISSSALLSQDDLEDLYGNIDDNLIVAVAKKQNLRLPEDMQEEIEEEVTDVNDFKYEIESAIGSANYALQCLCQAQEAIDASSGISFMDMISKNFFPSFLKYTSLEEAEQELRNAQSALECFNYALSNLLNGKGVRLQYAKLASVFDLWHDSDFMDYLVHLQIGKVQKRIRKAISQVEAIKRELIKMYNQD